MEEVMREYAAQLADLKMNSKPIINVLTMLAEDRLAFAPQVVQIIEKHLTTVPPNIKLPVLYLIDSIIKNVGKDFPSLFTQNLVSTFCGVFEKVDEKTRLQMFKLRQTWNDVFPHRKLYAIDVKCHQLDKNWPMSQPPSTSASGTIHVNPKFLNKNLAAGNANKAPLQAPRKADSGSLNNEAEMRAKLLEKQKQLLELQQKKIELELQQMQERAKLTSQPQQQQKQQRSMESIAHTQKALLRDAERAKMKTQAAVAAMNSKQHSHSVPAGVISAAKPASALNNKPEASVNKNKDKTDKDKKENDASKKHDEESKDRGHRDTSKEPKSRSSSSSKDSSSSHSHKSDKKEKLESPKEKSRPHSPAKIAKSTSSIEEERDREPTDPRRSKSYRKVSEHSHSESDDSSRSSKSKKRSSSKDSRDSRKSSHSSHSSHKSKDKDKSKSKSKSRSPDRSSSSKSSKSADEQDTYESRRSAVLKRNYRKTTGIRDSEEVENKVPDSSGSIKASPSSSDVDLRHSPLHSQEEPPSKKSRGGAGNAITDLFGHEDVDLRQSGSWSQVKKIKEERLLSQDDDQDMRDILQQHNTNRPAPPPSPANSVSSQRSGCDPLGRPRLYNKLPEDPEERRRSLDTRTQSFDSLERFRRDYIESAIDERGELSDSDIHRILNEGQKMLSPEQHMVVVEQLQQIREASAVREVQQMQMRGLGMRVQQEQNPWDVAAQVQAQVQNPWPLGFPAGPAWGPGPAPNQWNPLLPTPPGPNPFLVDDAIPPANEAELRAADRDGPSSIPIDKVMRQVRFYGDTAVIMMGSMGEDPRQISFKRDSQHCTVLINQKPLKLVIGETKRFDLNGKHHSIRIGAPTRELYIDDRHYEVYFGGPAVSIMVDNRRHFFELVGKPPEVEVGSLPRYDLIAGRATLLVDAVDRINIFLDEKPQKLDLFNEPVILKFCEGFKTVLLNGRPFPTNFGHRLPFTVTIPNVGKHYLKFLELPPSAKRAINHFMAARQNHLDLEARGKGRRRRGMGRGLPGRDHDLESMRALSGEPDMFNFADHQRPPPRDMSHSYHIEPKEEVPLSNESENSNDLPDVSNLLALAAKLGLLPSADKEEEKKEKDGEVKMETNENEAEEVKDKKEEKKKSVEPKQIPPLPTVDVFLTSEEKNYFKERREILINQLWTGVQCASCGLRFPPDQNARYSQHLDWHFRKNRREKANQKKAHSRAWYYDLSDWIQFEEVEDLEERAASLFELQDEAAEAESKSPSSQQPKKEESVLAAGHEGALCPQCGETFESYYDEDKEEWRLKDARLDDAEGEEKLYHVICHEDYMKSMVEEPSQEGMSSVTVDLQGQGPISTDAESASEAEIEKDPIPMAVERDVDTPGTEPMVADTSTTDTPTTEPLAVDISAPVTAELSTEDTVVTPEPEPMTVDSSSERQEDEDEVLILKEGKKEVVLMEIDVDDEEASEVKESDASVDNKEVSPPPSTEKESDPLVAVAPAPAPSYTLISRPVPSSPVVLSVDEDSSSMLPGMSEEFGGGVFQFALSSRERSESPEPLEERKIVYKPMEFEFPKIKIEPPDSDQEEESAEVAATSAISEPMPDIPLLPNSPSQALFKPPPALTEASIASPIDLTGEDEDEPNDTVDGGPPKPQTQVSIDGNSQMDGNSISVPFVPTKIRINIAGLDLGSPSRKEKDANSTDQQKPQSPSSSSSTTNGGKSPLPDSNSNAEIVFTDELKKLKPRLVGRKLTNCPPKQGNKEESGLCVIS